MTSTSPGWPAKQLGDAARDQGDAGLANKHYREALELDPQLYQARANLALILLSQGDRAAAVDEARTCTRQQPGNALLADHLGYILYRAARYAEAVTEHRRALQLEPSLLSAWVNLGNALRMLEQLDEAEQALRQALTLQAALPEATINLADLLEQCNRGDEAAALLDDLPPAMRRHPAAARLDAILLSRQGHTDEALALLSSVPIPAEDTQLAEAMHFELGRLYDRGGQPEQAYSHLAEANRLARGRSGQFDARRYRQLVNEANSVPLPPISIPAADNPSADSAPLAVLVGFPRSGTTLLDQILSSHSQLEVLEEQPLIENLLARPGANKRADELSDAERLELRRRYLDAAQHLRGNPDRYWIDKFPLNLIHLPLIMRLFPETRVIVALRHPCDVCLSNFMQSFRLNDAMANFTSLEDSARLYQQVMGPLPAWLETLGPRAHCVRYEDLISNFEASLRDLLAFLQLPWENTLHDYRRQAEGKSRVRTPSYRQVTEALYSRAAGRWQGYRRYLEPQLPVLTPLAEAFGYTTDA